MILLEDEITQGALDTYNGMCSSGDIHKFSTGARWVESKLAKRLREAEAQVERLEKSRSRLRMAVEKATKVWCIRPQCQCWLCKALAEDDKEMGE